MSQFMRIYENGATNVINATEASDAMDATDATRLLLMH